MKDRKEVAGEVTMDNLLRSIYGLVVEKRFSRFLQNGNRCFVHMFHGHLDTRKVVKIPIKSTGIRAILLCRYSNELEATTDQSTGIP